MKVMRWSHLVKRAFGEVLVHVGDVLAGIIVIIDGEARRASSVPPTVCAPPPPPPETPTETPTGARQLTVKRVISGRSGPGGEALHADAKQALAATYPPIACPHPSALLPLNSAGMCRASVGIAAAKQRRNVPRRRGFQDSKLELRPRPPQPRFAEVAIVSKMACIGADVRLRACVRARLRFHACGVRHVSWSAAFATRPTGQAVLHSRPSADGLVVTSESISFLYIPKVRGGHTVPSAARGGAGVTPVWRERSVARSTLCTQSSLCVCTGPCEYAQDPCEYAKYHHAVHAA
jgi:hypothetical protein